MKKIALLFILLPLVSLAVSVPESVLQATDYSCAIDKDGWPVILLDPLPDDAFELSRDVIEDYINYLYPDENIVIGEAFSLYLIPNYSQPLVVGHIIALDPSSEVTIQQVINLFREEEEAFTSPQGLVTAPSGSFEEREDLFTSPTVIEPGTESAGTGLTGQTATSPAALSIVPNPATDSITVSFECEDGGFAELAIFDISGRRVDTIYLGSAVIGRHEQVYDTSALPTGVYIVRLATEKATTTQRLVIAR